MKQEHSTSSFPRLSIGGMVILALYLTVHKILFDQSIYGKALRSNALDSLSSKILNSVTVAASALNVTSHALVVLGALNDTYVLSIIVGVGFDVLTRIVHLLWWTHLSWIASASFGFDGISVGFWLLVSMVHGYHFFVHLRALNMNASRERLQSVLKGALNNLRGIPGDGFHDHIFAYSDLGSHSLPMILSAILLHKQRAWKTALWVLLVLGFLSYAGLSRIPLRDAGEQTNPDSLLKISSHGSLLCTCKACRHQSRRTNQKVSFVFHPRDGVCSLWLYSFEALSGIIDSSVLQSTKLS